MKIVNKSRPNKTKGLIEGSIKLLLSSKIFYNEHKGLKKELFFKNSQLSIMQFRKKIILNNMVLFCNSEQEQLQV